MRTISPQLTAGNGGLYLLGLLSARLDEHAIALEHAAELERRAGSSFAPAFVRGLGRTVRVEVARARGHMDQALATLDSAGFWASWKVRVTGNSPFYFHEYEQLVRAELLHAVGREDEALQAYRGMPTTSFTAELRRTCGWARCTNAGANRRGPRRTMRDLPSSGRIATPSSAL